MENQSRLDKPSKIDIRRGAGPCDGDGCAVEGAELEVAHPARLVQPRFFLRRVLRDRRRILPAINSTDEQMFGFRAAVIGVGCETTCAASSGGPSRYLGSESVLAYEGAHAAELGLPSLQHVVLVHDHSGEPRGAQRHVEILGEV